MGKFIDLSNKRFGRLTVLNISHKHKKYYYWNCVCDCGKQKVVAGYLLTSGGTRSCGCLKRESDSSPKSKLTKDLMNQKFGHLTVVNRCGSDHRGEALWECKCDCGNPNNIIVLGSNLRSGHTQSCGCERMSHGEIIIANLLIQNNIDFQYEYSAFKFENSNKPARFDFYVSNKYFIEFDGETHFVDDLHGWSSHTTVEEQQKRDRLKDDWCINNNIPLIRIPYTHRDSISIYDLLLIDSNPFVVINPQQIYYGLEDLQNDLHTQKTLYEIKHKCISQFSLSGEYIKTFDSIQQASEELNIREKNIYDCLNKTSRWCGLSRWRFGADTSPLEPIKLPYTMRKVGQYDSNGNLISTFSNLKEASQLLGLKVSYRACIGKLKTSCGYKWKFID